MAVLADGSVVLKHGVDFARLAYARFGMPEEDMGEEQDPVWALVRNLLVSKPASLSEPVAIGGVRGAFMVPNLLNNAECDSFIRIAEHIGFSSGVATVGMPESIRDNEVCVMVTGEGLLEEVSRRLHHAVPKWGAGGSNRCSRSFINARFRCYRYRFQDGKTDGAPVSQKFGPHKDGSQSGSYASNGRMHENKSVRSQMSVLLYLNDEFSGGETVFYPSGTVDESSGIRVAPQRGAALCFWHGEHLLSPLHEGSALKWGGAAVKYVIRTDVLFEDANS